MLLSYVSHHLIIRVERPASCSYRHSKIMRSKKFTLIEHKMFRSVCTGAFWNQESFLILLYSKYPVMDHSYFFSMIQKNKTYYCNLKMQYLWCCLDIWCITSNDLAKIIPNVVDLFLRLKLLLKLNTNLLSAWKPYWSYTKLLVSCMPIHTVDLRTLIWFEKTFVISTL